VGGSGAKGADNAETADARIEDADGVGVHRRLG
jgi:hypothetical protein